MSTTFRRTKTGLYVPRLGAYGIAVMADNPAMFLRADQAQPPAGGSWVDSSGNSHPGIAPANLNQGLLSDTSISTTAPSGAHSFGGTGGRLVTVVYDGSSLFTATVFTIDFIMQPNSIGSGHSTQIAQSGRFSVQRSSTGTVSFIVTMSGGGTSTITIPSIFNATKFHLGFTVNGTTIRTYKNGVQASTTTMASAIAVPATGQDIIIGNDPGGAGGSGGLNGKLDEVAMYAGVELSSTRISAHSALQ